jgi:hypothetical protein
MPCVMPPVWQLAGASTAHRQNPRTVSGMVGQVLNPVVASLRTIRLAWSEWQSFSTQARSRMATSTYRATLT